MGYGNRKGFEVILCFCAQQYWGARFAVKTGENVMPAFAGNAAHSENSDLQPRFPARERLYFEQKADIIVVAVSGTTVPFPVSWTVKMKKKQKETQDILSYHSQAAGCSDKARAKASGGRQPIEECGRTGL